VSHIENVFIFKAYLTHVKSVEFMTINNYVLGCVWFNRKKLMDFIREERMKEDEIFISDLC